MPQSSFILGSMLDLCGGVSPEPPSDARAPVLALAWGPLNSWVSPDASCALIVCSVIVCGGPGKKTSS
eukprot:8306334-Pyramimonas_sp.AAC.1